MKLGEATGCEVPLVPDRLEIRAELGRGGMAVVYRAHDREREREVALKFLPPAMAGEALSRFRREADALSTLFHPNVVAFFGIDQWRGQSFIEMEYVPGGNLSDYLARGRNLSEILRLFTDICQGLEHIHNSGLVHRDLKPANILVSAEGLPKISDLGLAKQTAGAATRLTASQAVFGTLGYMAPEQLLSTAEVGPAGDIYALGVCLFEAATGTLPFSDENPVSLMQSHLQEAPPSPSSVAAGIPPALDRLLLDMLKKQPELRPTSAAEVRRRLALILEELSLHRPDPGEGPLARPELLEMLMQVGRSIAEGTGGSCLLLGQEGLGRSYLLSRLREGMARECPGCRILELSPGRELASLLELLELPAGDSAEASLASRLREALGRQPFPTLLVANDLERLDPATQKVLGKLAEMEPAGPSGWILSATPAMIDLFRGARRLEVRPLNRQEILLLAQSWLWGSPDPEVHRWLEDQSGGSPRRLRLAVQAVGWSEAFCQKDGGQWARVAGTPLPGDAPSVLVDQLPRLGSQGMRALKAAALLEAPFSLEALARASQLNALSCERTAAGLCKRGLLESDGGRLRLPHPHLLAALRRADAEPALEERPPQRETSKPARLLAAVTALLLLAGAGLSWVLLRPGEVEVVSDPPGAKVFVDGAYVGSSPLRHRLESGTHDVRVVREGYAAYEQQVEIAPGQERSLDARLEKPGSLLLFGYPEDARIEVDGELRDEPRALPDKASLPVPMQDAQNVPALNLPELSPGTHSLVIAREGYHTQKHQITIRPGQAEFFVYQLMPLGPPRP